MRSVLKKAQDTIEEFCTKNEEKVNRLSHDAFILP